MLQKEGSRSSKKWWWITAIVILVSIATVVYVFLRPRVQNVQVGVVSRHTMTNTIFTSGTVKPTSRQIIYSSELAGPIQSFNVKVGESVKVGQVLFSTASNTAQAAVSAAASSLQSAQSTYSALYGQFQSSPPSVQAQLFGQLQSARSAIADAQAQLTQANAALAATRVSSTLSGYVLLENATGINSDGSMVPVIEVVGREKKIVVKVSEVDAVQLHAGLQATLTSDVYPGQTWPAKVTQVANYALANANGTGQVEVDLQPTGVFPMPLGYQVDVHIVSSVHHQVPAIPYSALVQNGDTYGVFVLHHRYVKLTNVSLGITDNTYVEIVKGLQVGEKIVLNPPTNLLSGAKVHVS